MIDLWVQGTNEMPIWASVKKHKLQTQKNKKKWSGDSQNVVWSVLIIWPISRRLEVHLDAYNSIDIALDPIPYGCDNMRSTLDGDSSYMQKGETMASIWQQVSSHQLIVKNLSQKMKHYLETLLYLKRAKKSRKEWSYREG